MNEQEIEKMKDLLRKEGVDFQLEEDGIVLNAAFIHEQCLAQLLGIIRLTDKLVNT